MPDIGASPLAEKLRELASMIELCSVKEAHVHIYIDSAEEGTFRVQSTILTKTGTETFSD